MIEADGQFMERRAEEMTDAILSEIYLRWMFCDDRITEVYRDIVVAEIDRRNIRLDLTANSVSISETIQH